MCRRRLRLQPPQHPHRHPPRWNRSRLPHPIRKITPAWCPPPWWATAYRRSSPDSKPFIEIGTRVDVGDKLLLVEAMKTFNDIVCPPCRHRHRHSVRRRTAGGIWRAAPHSSSEASCSEKILIANRGEIALRIQRAAKELGHSHRRRAFHGRCGCHACATRG